MLLGKPMFWLCLCSIYDAIHLYITLMSFVKLLLKVLGHNCFINDFIEFCLSNFADMQKIVFSNMCYRLETRGAKWNAVIVHFYYLCLYCIIPTCQTVFCKLKLCFIIQKAVILYLSTWGRTYAVEDDIWYDVFNTLYGVKRDRSELR